jgi:hypothetical protein
MIKLIVRGCPPAVNPSVCPGVAPAQACPTAAPVTFGPDVHAAACYSWTVAPPSWWTPLHIGGVIAIAVCLAVLAGLTIAAGRPQPTPWQFPGDAS